MEIAFRNVSPNFQLVAPLSSSLGILRELQQNFPTISQCIQQEASGTIALLMETGAVQAFEGAREITFPNSGQSAGMWQDCYKKMAQHFTIQVDDDELIGLCNALSKHILDKWVAIHPRWVKSGENRTATYDVDVAWNQRNTGHEIVATVVGHVTAYERVAQNDYVVRVTSDLSLKMIRVDIPNLRKLEDEISKEGVDHTVSEIRRLTKSGDLRPSLLTKVGFRSLSDR